MYCLNYKCHNNQDNNILVYIPEENIPSNNIEDKNIPMIVESYMNLDNEIQN